MYKETFKSVILFILVVTSAILTYMVWSYQPEFSEVETSINATSNVGSSEEVTFSQMMRAYQLVRVDDSEITGSIQEDIIVGIREYLKDTEIEDVSAYNNLSRLDAVTKEDGSEDFLIVDYPSDMPAKTLFQVLGFKYEGSIPDYQFSRIIVDLGEDNIVFYLINDALDRVAIAPLDLESDRLMELLDSHEDGFEQYLGIITNQQTSNSKTAIYGPSNPGELPVENFLSSQIDPDLMNNILFTSDEYTSEQSDQVYVYEGSENIAKYNLDNFGYTYTNLDESLSGDHDPHQTIQKSFTYLKAHTGLSSGNILFDYLPDENQSIYRTTMNGHIVFSESINNTISVKYGQNSVYEYSRPLITVNARVPGEQDKALMPLENVRYQIALNEDLDLQKVSKIVIGYNMEFSSEQTELSVIEYTPEWYVQYDGEWFRFEEGGLEN